MSWHVVVIITALVVACIVYLVYRRYIRIKKQNIKFENNKKIRNAVEAMHRQPDIVRQLPPSEQVSVARVVEEGRFGARGGAYVAEQMYIAAADRAAADGDAVASADALFNLAQLYERNARVDDAFTVYLEAFRAGRDDAAIRIGGLYAFGMHPHYPPDKVAARHVYEMIVSASSLNPTTADIAAIKILEITTVMRNGYDPDVIEGVERIEMDVGYVWALRDAINVKENRENANVLKRGTETGAMTLFSALLNDVGTNTRNTQEEEDERIARMLAGDVATQFTLMDDAHRRRVQTVVRNVGAEDYGNRQNVHSTTAQNMAVTRLAAISTPDANNFLDASNAFRTELGIIGTIGTKDIERVLSSLTCANHSKYNKSEQDIFSDVWKRVTSAENAGRKADMIKVLAQNMTSGVENGSVVCSTGKIMRMLGSLDAMDADLTIAEPLKPEWAVNQELAGMAVSIRKRTMDAMDATSRAAFETGGDDAVSAKMRTELEARTKEEYVDPGILSGEDARVRLTPLLAAL